MKTSLNIDDSLFRAAQKEALRCKTTLSAIISLWARAGKSALIGVGKKRPTKWKTVDLGLPLIDLTKRSEWMDKLE